MRSKSFLKLMLVIAVLLGVQMGLLPPESALPSGCCYDSTGYCAPECSSCTNCLS
jgi:hypothetical protein